MAKRQQSLHQSIYYSLIGMVVLTGAFLWVGTQHYPQVMMAVGTSLVSSTPDVNKQQFIDEMVPHAQSIQQTYGVLPSIIIAQGILESNWGQSRLAQDSLNFFGIKGDKASPRYTTREYIGEWVEVVEPFRSYETMEASMIDHAELLVYGPSWNADHYREVINADTPIEAAYALQAAGYATDPAYADKLIDLIQTYKLYQYDL